VQPPKTATRRTRINATTNLTTRRIGAGVVVAGGLAVAMLASAAPAAAINPGGGRHRVQVERQQQSVQHQQTPVTTTPVTTSSFVDQELARLRMCESHDNYQDNTGNGYYGAYQFALQTWQDLGLTGRPDQAAPAVQDYAAKVLHSHAGWSPWPACSQREHLR
jgi:Transglycosylase-like domain